MRFACDTGGTFTDLIVEGDDGLLRLFKAPTTPDDPVRGVLDAVQVAADALGEERSSLLARGELFVHGTTRAINAIVTGSTARTALLTTKGNPDILLFREGGRTEPFNFKVPYPKPYIPRALTYEVPERIGAAGNVRTALDEERVREIALELKAQGIEAVAVCLLWSVANPAHELRVAEILAEMLPDVPVTLSHKVNPILREYRRASSAAIDASLKPLMVRYMASLEERLREAGFGGRLLVVTSQGGMRDARDIAGTPIHAINSGPAMAPIAGHHYADADVGAAMAIVADTGGTTYDVSLIRGGRIPWTNETWIGQPFRGHMTGFPSVDVRSVGAGGGSIASVDSGGLLHVGPESASAVPGPVCYDRGGTRPTVTDAALVLGYLDASNFLGGALALNGAAAREAIERDVAGPLGLSVEDAAAAIIEVATENMVQAIEDITVNQGMDPEDAVLIGGGGAAGFNSVLIAKRLRCRTLIFPETGAALSAAGALISDFATHVRVPVGLSTGQFDGAAAGKAFEELRQRCDAFIKGPAAGALESRIEFSFEGHYPSQVWDIEVILTADDIQNSSGARFAELFHRTHRELFAISDDNSPVEIVGVQARVRCRLHKTDLGRVAASEISAPDALAGSRPCYFKQGGQTDARIYALDQMTVDQSIAGPAIVESPLTTIVVNPGSVAHKAASGSLVVHVFGEA